MSANGNARWDDDDWVEGTDPSPLPEPVASPTLDFPADDWNYLSRTIIERTNAAMLATDNWHDACL